MVKINDLSFLIHGKYNCKAQLLNHFGFFASCLANALLFAWHKVNKISKKWLKILNCVYAIGVCKR